MHKTVHALRGSDDAKFGRASIGKWMNSAPSSKKRFATDFFRLLHLFARESSKSAHREFVTDALPPVLSTTVAAMLVFAAVHALLRASAIAFLALESQKCAARALGARHPSSPRRLDDLERRVLAEAGVDLVDEDRDYYREDGRKPDMTAAAADKSAERRRLCCRQDGGYERVRAFRERIRLHKSGAARACERRVGEAKLVARRRNVCLGGWQPGASRDAATMRDESDADAAPLRCRCARVDRAGRAPSNDGTHEEATVPRPPSSVAMSHVSDDDDDERQLDVLLSTPIKLPSTERAGGGMCLDDDDDDDASATQNVAPCLTRVISACSRPSRRDSSSSSSSLLSSSPSSPPPPSALSDADQLYMHTLVLGDERAMFADPTSPLRPIILLHGHSMSGVYYRHLFADLVERGNYVVYAVDLLGWGRSSRPRFTGSAEDAVHFWVDSLAQFIRRTGLEALCRCSGDGAAKRLDVVAHSLGAYVAAEYVIRHDRRREIVRNLVLVTPAGVTAEQPYARALYFCVTPQLVARRGGALGYALFRAKWPRNGRGYGSTALREYTYAMATRPGDRAQRDGGGSGDAAFARMVEVRHRRRAARCVRPLARAGRLGALLPCEQGRPPRQRRDRHATVRVIAAECDPLMRVDQVRAAYDDIVAACADDERRAACSFHVMRQCGHVPHLEAPQTFLRATGLLGDD